MLHCNALSYAMNCQRSQTAMHLAAELARIEVVEMLLKAGLDLTLRDRVRILTSLNYALGQNLIVRPSKGQSNISRNSSMTYIEKSNSKFDTLQF